MLMSNLQIAKILSRHYHTKDTFESCLSWDHMPEAIARYPSFFVTDIKHSNRPGYGHWTLLVFITPDSPSSFFDPLALPPQDYAQSLHRLLIENSNGTCIHNTVKVQDDLSTSCGGFVCFISDLMNRGLTMAQAVSYLSATDLKSNDAIVNRYLLTHMTQ